jgi:NADH-quinone oxidoreductase subunit J
MLVVFLFIFSLFLFFFLWSGFINFFLFYNFFLIILLLTILLVIINDYPINSLFFLILSFLVFSIILFFINLDFLALVFLIIYVGAIAILFLFMLMLVQLDIMYFSLFSLRSILEHFLILIIFIEILLFLQDYFYSFQIRDFTLNNSFTLYSFYMYYANVYNVIGQLFYTYFSLFFFLSGLFLFIIMLGTIILIQEESFQSFSLLNDSIRHHLVKNKIFIKL